MPLPAQPVRPPAAAQRALDRLPLLIGLVFFVVSTAFALAQHLTFHTRARDMGIYVQILWNAADGRPFSSTLLQENTNHLAEHVAPALWPLVPLAGLTPDAVPLLVLQQLALAACGWPLYRLARAGLGRGPAGLVLLSFYLMPAISRVSLSEFHPVVVAALPVAAGVAAWLSSQPRSAALLLLLALLMEEEAGPTVAALGIVLALRPRQRTLAPGEETRALISTTASRPPAAGHVLGPLLILVAVIWLVLSVGVVMPGFRSPLPSGRVEQANRTLSHYDQVQQDPNIIWTWLRQERGPDALSWLLLPNGGLALLAPELLTVALPGFAVLFLQDRAGTYAGHWSAPILPIVWLATAVGLRRVARRRSVLGAGLALMLVGTALAYGLDSYFPGGREFEADNYYTTPLESDLRRAVDLVPRGASLAATRRVVPHLAARRDLYQFPFTFYNAPLRPDSQRQDFYILDLTDTPTQRAVEVAESDSVLEKRPRYHVQRFGPDVLLLSRDRPEPPRPRSETFGGTVRLSGIDPPTIIGDGISFGLFWEMLRRPDAEIERTVRVVDRAGSVVAEMVGAPLDDYLPPRDWDRGQVVAEHLTVPAHGLSGGQRVMVGWRLRGGPPLGVDGSGAPQLELALPENR